jgi:hypothetical protein
MLSNALKQAALFLRPKSDINLLLHFTLECPIIRRCSRESALSPLLPSASDVADWALRKMPAEVCLLGTRVGVTSGQTILDHRYPPPPRTDSIVLPAAPAPVDGRRVLGNLTLVRPGEVPEPWDAYDEIVDLSRPDGPAFMLMEPNYVGFAEYCF